MWIGPIRITTDPKIKGEITLLVSHYMYVLIFRSNLSTWEISFLRINFSKQPMFDMCPKQT